MCWQAGRLLYVMLKAPCGLLPFSPYSASHLFYQSGQSQKLHVAFARIERLFDSNTSLLWFGIPTGSNRILNSLCLYQQVTASISTSTKCFPPTTKTTKQLVLLTMAQQYFADDLLLRLGYDPRDSILETKDLSSDLSALDTAFVASVDEQVEVWSNTPSKLSGNSETKETNTTSAFEKPETCKEKRKVGLGRPKGNAKSNAERCTEYRNRKRREEEQVYSDNLSLKRERKELLCTIADLENMVQAMQGEGYIDLTLENELLRKEIKVSSVSF